MQGYIAGVTRTTYSPRKVYFEVKLAYANFTPPMQKRLPPNTQELIQRDFFFYSPRKARTELRLARYKTSPSVMVRLLHAAASELRHEKDVLMSPEGQDQRGRG